MKTIDLSQSPKEAGCKVLFEMMQERVKYLLERLDNEEESLSEEQKNILTTTVIMPKLEVAMHFSVTTEKMLNNPKKYNLEDKEDVLLEQLIYSQKAVWDISTILLRISNVQRRENYTFIDSLCNIKQEHLSKLNIINY